MYDIFYFLMFYDYEHQKQVPQYQHINMHKKKKSGQLRPLLLIFLKNQLFNNFINFTFRH